MVNLSKAALYNIGKAAETAMQLIAAFVEEKCE